MKPPEDRTPVPPQRNRTIRQQLIDCLRHGPLSIGALSVDIGLSEKQLQEHLEDLRKQVPLAITPSRCLTCGFQFTNRRRIRKPGKCPKCRSTHIQEPRFALADRT